MIKKNILCILFLGVFKLSYSQIFIGDIKIGEPMPSKVNVGGYIEQDNSDCSCRVFATNQGTLGIHYENDTVVGIVSVEKRASRIDALQAYILKISRFMKIQEMFPGREFSASRDSKNGVVDGIFYFGYTDDKGITRTVTGVVGDVIIEENYFVNSNYQNKLHD